MLALVKVPEEGPLRHQADQGDDKRGENQGDPEARGPPKYLEKVKVAKAPIM
jgi:hypothetical protein